MSDGKGPTFDEVFDDLDELLECNEHQFPRAPQMRTFLATVRSEMDTRQRLVTGLQENLTARETEIEAVCDLLGVRVGDGVQARIDAVKVALDERDQCLRMLGKIADAVDKPYTSGGSRRVERKTANDYTYTANEGARMIADLYRVEEALRGVPDPPDMKLGPDLAHTAGVRVQALASDASNLRDALQGDVFRCTCGAYVRRGFVCDSCGRE